MSQIRKFSKLSSLTFEELCDILDKLELEYRLDMSEIDSDSIVVYRSMRARIQAVQEVKSRIEDHLVTRQIDIEEEFGEIDEFN